MKITNFSFTLRQAATEDGYGDNYYVNINEDGVTNISHPYKSIPHKEQAAILAIINSAIVKYGMLVNECHKANKALKLEEFVPKVSPRCPDDDIFGAAESTSESASPQSCALGDEEVSRGADGDIDKAFEEVETGSDKA